jgi:hypothetical protein
MPDTLDHSGILQVTDDFLHGAFGDADACGDVAQP